MRIGPLGVVVDARLVRLASRGDERAFGAIFRRYHQPLYRYCRAITGNAEDASDALQNSMVRAMRALPGERRAIELKPWLFRVAHNESVSLLRRRRNDAPLEGDLGGSVEGPEAGWADREELRELMSDLSGLPERQRAAVVLRELSGLSYAEIGSAFDTSTAAAKQAAYDGRVALQEYAKGRAMDCDAVTRAISDGDGKFLRGRRLRGHLRACADCASFKQALDARSGRLDAIAPALPAPAAAALMHKLFAGGGSVGGGSAALSAAGGKLVASVGALKSTTAVVAATTVAAGAAAGAFTVAPHVLRGSQPVDPPRAHEGPVPSRATEAPRERPAGDDAAPKERRFKADGIRAGEDSGGRPAPDDALDRGPAHGWPAGTLAPGSSRGADPGSRAPDVARGNRPAGGRGPGGEAPSSRPPPPPNPVTSPTAPPAPPPRPPSPTRPAPPTPPVQAPELEPRFR